MVIYQILVLILGVLCLKCEGTVARQFVLQNEMSEHCRRRVMSSIFLGRQVSESSAEVIHFSRLDLPYSCSLSVRTESGSNIILVILSKSERSIINSCTEGHNQLLVYEMGETFGGYWGALPESVFQQEPRNLSTYYTLKTTETLSETIDIGTGDYDTLTVNEEIVSTTTQQDEIEDGYVVMEVPLVNVSGNIELGETESTSSDENELFDLIYDVTPKNGVLYDTSILPLVQFSFWKQNGRKQGLTMTEPRYQLDYNVNGFTPDYRLMFRTNNHKTNFFNRRYYSTRRINFKKKNKDLFSVMYRTSRIHPNPEYITKFTTAETLKNSEPMDFSTFGNRNDTWQIIERYLKLLNIKNSTTSKDLDDEALGLLKRISDTKHNASVYLLPKLSKYNDTDFTAMTKEKNVEENMNHHITTRSSLNILHLGKNDYYQNTSSTYVSSHINYMSTLKVKTEISTQTISSNIKNFPQEFTTAMPRILKQNSSLGNQSTFLLYSQLDKNKSESGSLVNRESWENIVQVAPVMANLLNVTTSVSPNHTISKMVIAHTPSLMSVNKINRKKRYIQALAIEHHRPRQLTTRQYVPPRLRKEYELDSQNLAEVVELQDDEIQGRVALHYFNNYVGATVFNMCNYKEPKVRQAYLINSSRIIIAISNFTMDRITLVMTESRVARVTGCPPAHLECQVSGVRVCVHKMNACDGVPNCGAYDIYDEDRLLCGSSVGFHYTVWLAACTFLVVLLTLLYSVHYWLKRCVPKVSQAFFIYTDKSENILYLESIMRSPNDFDGSSRMVYHSSFYSEDDLSIESTKKDDGKIMSILKRYLRFLYYKKLKRQSSDIQKQLDSLYGVNVEPKTKFSFTEAELRKFGPITTRHVSIQTGNSLEMTRFKDIQSFRIDASEKRNKNLGKEPSSSGNNKICLEQSNRELTTLRRIRGISLQSSLKTCSVKNLEPNVPEYPVPVDEEVELRSTMYDRGGKRLLLGRQVLEKTKYEVHSYPPEEKRVATKHLRFEEGATTIESSAVDPNGNENNVDGRRKIFLNPDRLPNTDLDIIEEDEEAPSTGGRDFRRFWGKGKKNKKKKQLSIR